jgi:hypothetical protein
LPTLRRYVPLMVAVCLGLMPLWTQAEAWAWESTAGSPPAWQSYWVQTSEPVEVFANADGDLAFGQAAANLFFRVDAPEQLGRLWVYNPVASGWGWLPRASTKRVAEPTPDDVQASAGLADPRAYLYARAPDLAPRLDCIIAGESGWDPAQQNPRSHAAGLAQFLPSTWATTPEGQRGLSPFEPLASIDAAIWLAQTKGLSQWQVYSQGRCR